MPHDPRSEADSAAPSHPKVLPVADKLLPATDAKPGAPPAPHFQPKPAETPVKSEAPAKLEAAKTDPAKTDPKAKSASAKESAAPVAEFQGSPKRNPEASSAKHRNEVDSRSNVAAKSEAVSKPESKAKAAASTVDPHAITPADPADQDEKNAKPEAKPSAGPEMIGVESTAEDGADAKWGESSTEEKAAKSDATDADGKADADGKPDADPKAEADAAAKAKPAAGGDSGLVRWNYLRPRLLAAAVLSAYGYFLSDPTLHWGMMLGYEKATGVRLDVESFRTNWKETSMQFGPVRAANPSKPVENIVEAEHVSLHFDRDELLRGRYIVSQAEVRDLQIGTLRDDGGRPHFAWLSDLLVWLGWIPTPSAKGWIDVDEAYLRSQVKGIGKSQAKSLEDKLRTDLAAMQLEAPQESRRIKEFWSKETAEAKAQAEWIKTHARELQAKLKPSGNVLEKAKAYQEAIGELNQLVQYSDQVRARVTNWPGVAQADSTALRGAAQRDYAKLHQRVDEFEFSSEDLADYLIGETMVERIKSVTQTVAFARSFQYGDDDGPDVDSAAADAKAGRTKGTYFDFFSGPPQPQWWMKELKLSGRGEWQKKPLQFFGTVTDVSSHPARVKEPTALHLVFREPLPGTLEGRMDRRTGAPRDTLQLRCPEVEMTNQTLGKPDDLQIQLTGGKASLEVDLLLEGEKLTGQVRFLQPQTGWTVAAQGLGEAAWVSQALQGLQGRSDLDLTIDLSGTLQKPNYKVRSEFPKAIAAQFQGRWKTFAGDFTKRFGEQLASATAVDEQGLANILNQEPSAILGDLTKTLDEVKKLPNMASQPLKGLEKLFRK